MIDDLFKDMGKYLPAQIIPGIVGFISIPVFTRLFSPEEYGEYVLVLGVIGVFVTVIGWLSVSAIRFYPAFDRDERTQEFYGTAIRLTFISTILLALLYFVILLFVRLHIPVRLHHLMRIGILVFIFSAFYQVFQHFHRMKRQIGLYSVFAIWRSAATLAFAVILVMVFQFGVEGLLWGAVISLAAVLPVLWKKAVGSFSSASPFSIPLTKEMARYGFPLVAGNLAAWVLSLSDRYVLQIFRSSREVGIYSASYSISERSIMVLVTLFWLAFSPLAAQIWEMHGEGKSREFVSKVTRYYLIACLPAVVGLSVLARPMVCLMTERRYLGGYEIFPLIVQSVFFMGLAYIFQAGFAFSKRTNFITFSVVVSGLLNVVLNLLLVPRYGYRAAAFTTLISYAFLLVLTIRLSRRFFVWEFPFTTLARAGCSALVMGGLVFLLNRIVDSPPYLELLLGVGVGVTIYSLILFMTGELNRTEIRTLTSLIRLRR